MRVGIDIDGIVLDFERTMRTYAELYDLLILRKNGVTHPSEFDYLKRYDWTNTEKKEFIDNYLVYATINSTPLIPLIKEMLEILEKEDIEYYFITSRGLIKSETKDAVTVVFKKNNIKTNNIHFATKDKVEKCIELGIDIMIEDNPNTCKKLSSNAIKTLYFRDKDNEKLPENEYLTEVSNIGEICRQILNIKGFNNNIEVYKKILKIQ